MDFGEPNEMRTAICLVRAEVSRHNTARHTSEVVRHAGRRGYLSLRTVHPPADDPDPVGSVLELAADLNVDAIVVHDLETVCHTPSRVCEMFDLETVSPPMTWAVAMPGVTDPAHTYPDHPLTSALAQRIMQQHLTCRATECPRKASAYGFLVRVGKIVPPVNTPRERAALRGLPFRPRHVSNVPLPEGVDLKTLLDVLAGLTQLECDTRASAGRADLVVGRPTPETS